MLLYYLLFPPQSYISISLSNSLIYGVSCCLVFCHPGIHSERAFRQISKDIQYTAEETLGAATQPSCEVAANFSVSGQDTVSPCG